MTTGRRTNRWTRVYHDGYDISGNARSLGNMGITYNEANLTAFSDPVAGYLPHTFTLTPETINGLFDNTATTGLHNATVGRNAGDKRTLMIALGVGAEPAVGDVCFSGQFTQGAYQIADDGGAAVVTLPYQGWAADASIMPYAYRPFGVVIHAKGAEIAVNTATGLDDEGAATAKGGFMCYQVFAGNGTATLKVQDAATNLDASFADITGVTTGVIDFSSVKFGIIASTTLTIRRYLRWQIVLGTATTVTFALAFTRG